MPKAKKSKMDPVKRERANVRERNRVTELNGMFEQLLNILPPSPYNSRLTKEHIIREATSYIHHLTKFLNNPSSTINPVELFPHIFNRTRQPNNRSWRHLSKEGIVNAYVSTRSLPPTTTPTVYPDYGAVAPTPIEFNQNNYFITYF